MKNLIRFFYKYHFFLLFLLIQFFSFYLVVQHNNYQKTSFLNSSNSAFAVFYEAFNNVSSYFGLKKENKILIEENKKLHNLFTSNYETNKIKNWQVQDSIYKQKYHYNVVEVINNSVNKQRNYITINKGHTHGLKPEMAVVSPQGIVGVVKDAARVIEKLADRDGAVDVLV